MIQKIKIRNFQSHKNTEIEFSPGVNVIIGKSDSGKSAILRSLNWIINNKPNGNNFINNSDPDNVCEVIVETDNNKIRKIKSKKENKYFLNEKEFSAFGQDVPDEVKENFNFNELNIQYQLDKPFLLSDSAGEVAQILNRTVNLELIDISLKNIESMKRKNKNNLESFECEKKRKQEEFSKYEWIEKAEKDLSFLKEKELVVENKKIDLERLKTIAQQKKEIDEKVMVINRILIHEKEISGLIERQESLKAKQDSSSFISSTIVKIKETAESLEEGKRVLIFEKEISGLIEKDKINNSKKTESDIFSKKISLIKETKKEISEKSAFILKQEKEFKMVFPAICPLCGK